MRLCNQRVEAAREHLLVEARSGHIEIEPSPTVGNLTAGHRPLRPLVTLAKAGVQGNRSSARLLDSRFRGNDGNRGHRWPFYSHGGVGRSRAFRNSGLNNLDW